MHVCDKHFPEGVLSRDDVVRTNASRSIELLQMCLLSLQPLLSSPEILSARFHFCLEDRAQAGAKGPTLNCQGCFFSTEGGFVSI